MSKIKIDLHELAFHLEKCTTDIYQESLRWGEQNGVSAEYITYVWDQFDTRDGDIFIPMCHDVASMDIDLSPTVVCAENPWKLPSDYISPDPETQYSKFLISRPQSINSKYVYTMEGEYLIPAPYGLKAKKPMRHQWHFLVGCESSLPSLCGIIVERDTKSAQEFLDFIIRSPCYAMVGSIGLPEVTYFLGRLEKLPTGKLAGVSYIEMIRDFKNVTQIQVSKILV